MKAKVTKLSKFQPFDLVISIDSEDELAVLQHLFSYDQRVPDVVYPEGAGYNQMLSNLMTTLHGVLFRAKNETN